jgi:hypothetical protein
MPHRPLSFTKNLGGLEHLYAAIRRAYRPGTTLQEFESRLPGPLANRRLVMVQFFIATRLIGRAEYVLEDALIQTTLSEPYGATLARLYLFALLLNMAVDATVARLTNLEARCHMHPSVRGSIHIHLPENRSCFPP